MIGRPLLLLATASAVLAGGLCAGDLPAATAVPLDSALAGPSAGEAEAVALLGTAAVAARARSWSGTQYVASFRDGGVRGRLVQVVHDPVTGTRTAQADRTGDGDWTVVPPVAPDASLLGHLARGYALDVVGTDTCTGRDARVVEVRRTDGRVAGRFWLDAATGLPLRREVWDAQGRPLASSTFVDLEVQPAAEVVRTAADRRVVHETAAPAVDVPELPGGYLLFATSSPHHDGVAVLQQSYSDGMSTISVFSQPGRLGDGERPSYRRVDVGRGQVWVRPGTPERAVWSGGGRVFTAVSDASSDDLLAAVRAFPQDPRGGSGDGVGPRLKRGVARIGSWLDPTG